MKNQAMSRRVKKLLGAGLFIQTFPMLFHHFFVLNDFFSGFLRGLGLALIVTALIFQQKKNDSVCKTYRRNV